MLIVSSKENTVLLGPKDMVGKPLKLASISQAKSKKNGWNIEKWPDGKEYLTGYAFGDGYHAYNGLGWTVLVRQPLSIAFNAANEIKLFIFILGVISAVCFGLIGWFLAGKIAKPLNRIAQAAEGLKNGEQREIPFVKGIKDIEVLSLSLREMVTTITQTKSELGQMETIAHHDHLTGLPNRIALYSYIDSMMEKQNASNQLDSLVVMFADLDGFKEVNDTYGHQIGDQVLQIVADRLNQCLLPKEFVSRLGGDEFVFILNTNNEDSFVKGKWRADELINVIKQPILVADSIIKVGCSIGGAIWPQDGQDANGVLDYADQALYEAKKAGKNRTFFFQEIQK